MTLIEHKEHIAQKTHQCQWCETTIEQGDRYVRQRSAEQGEGAWTVKLHKECYEAFARLENCIQGFAYHYTPYTRGCTCERGDAMNCSDPKHPKEEA